MHMFKVLNLEVHIVLIIKSNYRFINNNIMGIFVKYIIKNTLNHLLYIVRHFDFLELNPKN